MQGYEDEVLKNKNLETALEGKDFDQNEKRQSEFDSVSDDNPISEGETVVKPTLEEAPIGQTIPAPVDDRVETPMEGKTETMPETDPDTEPTEPQSSVQPQTPVQPQSTAQSETIAKARTEGKKTTLILVGIMMTVIIVIVGVMVWNWAKRNLPEDENAPEAIYLGMQPDEENKTKEAMLAAYGEVGVEINDIAYQNDGLTFNSEGEDVYNYEIIERNINEYLAKMDDVSKKNQATAFSIDLLSSIGDTAGAKKIADNLSTETFSETDWYCYYQAMRGYYLELNDQENTKKYTDLLQEILAKTEER